MANTTLLSKFADFYKSNKFIDTTRASVISKRLLKVLDPKAPISDDPAQLLSDVEQRLDLAIKNNLMTDDDLMRNFVMGLQSDGLGIFGPEMTASILESSAAKALDPTRRKLLTHDANSAFGFLRVDQNNNLVNTVLDEEPLRRMIKAADVPAQTKTTANTNIDKALENFDQKTAGVDIRAMLAGPKAYGTPYTPQEDLMDKLRAGCVNLLGKTEGNSLADTMDAVTKNLRTPGEKNVNLMTQAGLYDNAVKAVCKRHNIDINKHPEAFLTNELAGNKKKHSETAEFVRDLAKTSAVTFGVTFVTGVVSTVPVIGDIVGPALAIGNVVRSAVKEYNKAKQIAKEQGRDLTPRERAKIGVNVASQALPTAIIAGLQNTKFGMAARILGSGMNWIKTSVADIQQKKAKLKAHDKLKLKDYLKSFGKGALQAAATFGAAQAGSHLGSALGAGLFSNSSSAAAAESTKTQDEANYIQDEDYINEQDATLGNDIRHLDAVSRDANLGHDVRSLDGVELHNDTVMDDGQTTTTDNNQRIPDRAVEIEDQTQTLDQTNDTTTTYDMDDQGMPTRGVDFDQVNDSTRAYTMDDAQTWEQNFNASMEDIQNDANYVERAQNSITKLGKIDGEQYYDINGAQVHVSGADAKLAYKLDHGRLQGEEFNQAWEHLQNLATEQNYRSYAAGSHEVGDYDLRDQYLAMADAVSPHTAAATEHTMVNDLPSSTIDNVNDLPSSTADNINDLPDRGVDPVQPAQQIDPVAKAMINPDKLAKDAEVVFSKENMPNMSVDDRLAAINAVKGFNNRLEYQTALQMSSHPELSPAEAQYQALESMIAHNPEYVANFQQTTGLSMEDKYLQLGAALNHNNTMNLEPERER